MNDSPASRGGGRQNLSAILTRLHHEGVQSRADLTRSSGLNRSTIGALVGGLAELGLVSETAPMNLGSVGRPSPNVHANERVVTIAVNPDVDAVIVGLVGLGGVVHLRERHETDGIPSVSDTVDIVRAFAEGIVGESQERYQIVGVGLAVPGLVRAEDGLVMVAPHLGWQAEPLAERISNAVGLPTVVANDAKLGMIAESIYGAGRGVEDFVYLNGSRSGIGGGVLVGALPLRGAEGYGAELGHTLANSTGDLCRCGRRGCLETEVNLARLLRTIGLDAIDADELDELLTVSSSRQLAREVERQLGVLASSIASINATFNPELVVLGGYLGSLLAAQPGRLLREVRRAHPFPASSELRIERAQLGSRLLMVGAAELAFAPLLTDPASISFGPTD